MVNINVSTLGNLAGMGDPMFIHIEDDHMEADEVCMAGWIVEGKRGPLLVGTVVSHRTGDVVSPQASHGHSYIKDLPGRKVTGFYPIAKWRKVA